MKMVVIDMVYVDGVKIKNTDDIISHLSKLSEIKRVIKESFDVNRYKGMGINFDNVCNDVLYNIVDDLKGHQDIEDLENEIIEICNYSIDKNNLEIKK